MHITGNLCSFMWNFRSLFPFKSERFHKKYLLQQSVFFLVNRFIAFYEPYNIHKLFSKKGLGGLMIFCVDFYTLWMFCCIKYLRYSQGAVKKFQGFFFWYWNSKFWASLPLKKLKQHLSKLFSSIKHFASAQEAQLGFHPKFIDHWRKWGSCGRPLHLR